MTTRRSHNKVVLECYQALKHSDNPYSVLRRYGKKTRDEAVAMCNEDYKELTGHYVWEEGDD